MPSAIFPVVELATSATIVLISFFIFFQTREFYRLSAHKGIKYFRYAFLFFGFSFLLELLRPLMFFLGREGFFLRPFFFIISVYAGTTAILCLLYSVLWKKLDGSLNHPLLFINLIGLLVAIITFLEHYRFLVLAIHVVLFVIVLIISYTQKTKKSTIHLLYLLLFLSWITDVVADPAMRHSSLTGLVLDILSMLLFLVLAYLVLKKTHVAT